MISAIANTIANIPWQGGESRHLVLCSRDMHERELLPLPIAMTSLCGMQGGVPRKVTSFLSELLHIL